MANEFTITVNGKSETVRVDENTPLLYVLRNELHLSGPRYGCGMAQCGACAVLADGKEIRSCVTPIRAVGGRAIHTTEGLAALWIAEKGLTNEEAAKTLHPIQQAWIDEQVPQCGYCQSGMIIAAANLLRENPAPSVVQIKNAFTDSPPSPHLCRCGTYVAIIAAVQRAAKAMSA